LGIDARQVSLSGYFEALEAYNDMQPKDDKPQPNEDQKERLRALMAQNG
jgi:hypothetical protein